MAIRSRVFRARSLELGELIKVSSEQLGSLDVVPDVDLLVLRVSAVVASPHRQQDDVLAGSPFQGNGDWDGATLAGQIRLNAVDHLGGLPAGDVVGVIGVGHPAAASVEHESLHLVGRAVLGPLLVDVVLEKIICTWFS